MIKHSILIAFLAFSLANCIDNTQSSIPNYPVYLALDLATTYSAFRNTSNQFVLYENQIFYYDRIGYGGIFVYTGLGLDDSGNTQYYAFDMACPYEAKSTIKVYPDSRGLPQVVCEECGSVFDVGNGYGYPVSGPAKVAGEFLKQYKTSLSGSILYITSK